MTQLEKLRFQIGIDGTAQDTLLQLLLDDAASDLLTWCNRISLPAALEPTQRQIAIIRYNTMGVEGQTSHSEGGVSRSFEELPMSIRNIVGQFRLMKVATYAPA